MLPTQWLLSLLWIGFQFILQKWPKNKTPYCTFKCLLIHFSNTNRQTDSHTLIPLGTLIKLIIICPVGTDTGVIIVGLISNPREGNPSARLNDCFWHNSPPLHCLGCWLLDMSAEATQTEAALAERLFLMKCFALPWQKLTSQAAVPSIPVDEKPVVSGPSCSQPEPSWTVLIREECGRVKQPHYSLWPIKGHFAN